MSESDQDIEFDFFDDLDEGERPPPPDDRPRQQRPPGGPPPRKPSGRPPQVSPTARLIGLIAFGILIIVLLVLWVQSCSGSSKKSHHQSYMAEVATHAAVSNRLGREFTDALTTPGIKASELAAKIEGFARRQKQDLQSAKTISPPTELRTEQAAVLQALQFRVFGLQGIADTLRTDSGSTDVATTSLKLAVKSQRLVASDVIWEDDFRVPANAIMVQQGVTGVSAPSSAFLTETGVDSQAFWTPVVQRVTTNTATGGGATGAKIGTALLGVKALPSGTPLSTTQETTVTAGTDLGFVVSVQNSGDSQVVRIKVTLTIKQPPQPIVANGTIPVINPGETKTVTFTKLGTVQFATKTTVSVDVAPVTGESNPDNNSASYPVIFSLG